MAEDAGSELARSILRNIIPLEQMGGAINQGVDAAGQKAMSVLQQLGLVAPPAPAAPPINAPLPRYNPQTGGIDQPRR